MGIAALFVVLAGVALIVRNAAAPGVSLVPALIVGELMTAFILLRGGLESRSRAVCLFGAAYIATIATYNIGPLLLRALGDHTWPRLSLSIAAHMVFALCTLGYTFAAGPRELTALRVRDARAWAVMFIVLSSATAISLLIAFARVENHTPYIATRLAWAAAFASFGCYAAFIALARCSLRNMVLHLTLLANCLDALLVAASASHTLGSFVAQLYGMASCTIIPVVYLVQFDGEYWRLTRAAAALANQAFSDPLTGLKNRRFYEHRLLELWDSVARARRTRLSMLVVDIDHFKRFNDRFGHPAGDECLRRTSEAILDALRGTGGEAIRYGGEEFVILLPGVRGCVALEIAERLRQNICLVRIKTVREDCLTVSVGVAEMIPADCNPQQLFAAADAALYSAKKSGRNRVVLFESSMSAC